MVSPINSNDPTDWLSHIGAQAYIRASLLFTRELTVYAQAGLEYWFTTNDVFFSNYGGLGFGAGVSYKL